MAFQALILLSLAIFQYFPSRVVDAQETNGVFPAMILFGDSAVDTGNNNYFPPASFKANYPPYGKDFIRHRPTGRFTNGKLAVDITGGFLIKLGLIIAILLVLLMSLHSFCS